MNLIKNEWSQKDINALEDYLSSLANKDKIEWTKSIINTSLPVHAIKLGILKNFAKDISKGNFESFLEKMPDSSYEILIISAYLINNLKDFDKQEKYLRLYGLKCDNWSNCDTLKFRIKNHESDYLKLSRELVNSKLPFVRRIGVNILFTLLKNDKYLEQIFYILDQFDEETEYYVNMVNAWLICELFIKHRAKTIEYLNKHNLNTFTINKAIQKCRDSYRINSEDKEMLLQYKV